MISEYANGKFKWLLTTFFLLWGMATLLIIPVLWSADLSIWAKAGLILVAVSGIGAIMGGLFDIRHKLHGLSFMLGVPALPAGALLTAYQFVKFQGWNEHTSIILLTAHMPWISVVLMGISMALLFSGFKKAGVAVGPEETPPENLPEGVIGVAGYANRLLVLTYQIWIIVMALLHLKLHS